ncbi:MAG: hypothetical protein M0Z46_05470 [Actinomycetota bacterium]|jgi:hypothetical protein|nr:hypothetical protein [Actinomycetota bacterium]
MTGGLASGPGAPHALATAAADGGDGGRRPGRLLVPAAPLRIPARVFYSKHDVFGLCDALARAERALSRAGEPEEAARLAAAFDLLEAGLA